MEEYLKGIELDLFGTSSNYELLEVQGKFADLKNLDWGKLRRMRDLGIPGEPVYSLHSIQRMVENEKGKNRDVVYFHQGGILPGIIRGG